MSTSDQQGDRPLTRKQLREIRLTGSTPVVGEDEAAAAAKQETSSRQTPQERPASPAEVTPAPLEESKIDPAATPLTRRQARAQERIRTASVPVVEPMPEPVPAAPAPTSEDEETAFEEDVDAESDEFSAVLDVSDEQAEEDDADQNAEGEEDELPVADAVITGERPIVSPTFGTQLLGGQSEVPDFAPSFDELITADSGGSHRAPNTLIFTHPGEGSLSGPVASTGEVLVTGSYELPRGLGSQGHAHGTDGREIDAVLIDGELPPASSPTPIAASSAVSTSKPAGEVIRPPAPEKGNKLMLTLAITAGGLALALAVALIVAFTTNVFG